MKKKDLLYKAMGEIKDGMVSDAAEYEAEKRDFSRLRTALEAVAVVAVACGFVVLSVVLTKVSGPKTDPAAVGTDTGTEQVTETEKDREITDNTDKAPDTEAPDTEAPDTEVTKTEEEKFFIKLYSKAYDGFVGVKDGVLVARDYKGLHNNPYRVSKELPGSEALMLTETMKKEDVQTVIGNIAGGIDLADNDIYVFWDYELSDGKTFCLTAHFMENEDKNGFIYVFDKLPLTRLKAEILKAELKKSELSEDKKAEFEKTLSELDALYEEYSEEYCSGAAAFAKRLAGFEIPYKNDVEYASELINTVFTAMKDNMQSKREYDDLDYDDDLKRLTYEGFILQDFCDIIGKNNSAEDMIKAASDLYDKIRIKNKYSVIIKYHEVSPYIEYDYLVNYNKNDGYSEYVRISTRYNAVLYYKETPEKETVYSIMYSDGRIKNNTPEQVRKNVVSAEKFEESTGIKIDFNFDQTLVDLMLDRIYSHPETSDMTYRLKETLEYDKNYNVITKEVTESDCKIYCIPFVTKVSQKLESPYAAYCYNSYPEYSGIGGDNETCIIQVSFTTDKIKICGIGLSSTYEEFEETFASLGFIVTKNGNNYRAEDKETGLSISVADVTYYNNGGKQERVMIMNLSPMQRSVINY